MKDYVVRRLLYVVVVLVAVVVVGFLIIELPTGDFVTTLIAQLEASGQRVEIEEVERLRPLYGLNSPVYVRFFKWASRLVRGQFGVSLAFNRPVKELILERLPVTIALSIVTLLFTYVVAIPIGIYSATRQYSLTDFALTTLGFVGLATPNFLLALDPIVSTIGWVLPAIVSGEAITAVVLSLPTTGPLLLNALLAQDMYLAATIVVLLTVLTVIGTLLSDIVLVTLDPRIRYERAPGT